MLSNLK